MTDSALTMFGLLLTSAHIIGAGLIIRGLITLFRGIQGEGQSASGIDSLRETVISLLSPLWLALLSLALLIGMTYWERSPLTLWIQLIAPLSTMLWVIWGHYSAQRVQAGAFFEALFPLSVARGKDTPLSRTQEQRSIEWSHQHHSLDIKSFVKTAIRAVEDESEHNKKRLDLDQLLWILRDSFQELHQALSHFPLADRLTLADWIHEVDRLGSLWGSGLDEVDKGRAFVNPFTLLDHKSLWRWSSAQPGELLERELSAWLHRGVYSLVTRRVVERFSQKQALLESSATTTSYDNQSGSPLLWRLLTRKITVPMGLYFILSAVAMMTSHGLNGLLLSVCLGVIIVHCVKRVLSLSRWRDCFDMLARQQRVHDEEHHHKQLNSLAHITMAEESFDKNFDAAPAISTLTFIQETSCLIAFEHRRPEHHQAPLAFCNVYLTDVALTAQFICEDVISWREEGGLFSTVLSAVSKLGISLGNVDEKLMQGIIAWTAVTEEEGAAPLVGDEKSDTGLLKGKALSADRWIADKRSGLGFLGSTAFSLASTYLQSSLKEKCREELRARVLALYQGKVQASQTKNK